jgi:hypothetical protein
MLSESRRDRVKRLTAVMYAESSATVFKASRIFIPRPPATNRSQPRFVSVSTYKPLTRKSYINKWVVDTDHKGRLASLRWSEV